MSDGIQISRRLPGMMVLAAALGFWSAMAVAQAPESGSYPPPYPRTNAKAVLQNDRVNAWDVYWPKGEPTPMHEHTFDQLSIALRGGSVRVTSPGKPPRDGSSKLGLVVLTPKGTIHQEEGTSDVPQHKIMLEIKPSTPMSMPPADSTRPPFPPEGTAKSFENARLIAWDFSWQSGQKVPVRSDFDTVTVFLVGGTIRSVNARGESKDTVRNPGDVAYTAHGPETHTEEAVDGSPRAIIVQLK